MLNKTFQNNQDILVEYLLCQVRFPNVSVYKYQSSISLNNLFYNTRQWSFVVSKNENINLCITYIYDPKERFVFFELVLTSPLRT